MVNFYLCYSPVQLNLQAPDMKVCIGGDLAGKVVDFDKQSFSAGEVIKGKRSEYCRRSFLVGKDVYFFWVLKDLKLWEATDLVEKYVQELKN